MEIEDDRDSCAHDWEKCVRESKERQGVKSRREYRVELSGVTVMPVL